MNRETDEGIILKIQRKLLQLYTYIWHKVQVKVPLYCKQKAASLIPGISR